MSQATVFGQGYSSSAPSESYAFMAPRLYKPSDGKTRGIIWLEGAGTIASTDFSGDITGGPAGAVTVMTDFGYPVLSADMDSTPSQPTWANPTSISRMTDAYNYLTGTLGAKSGKIGLAGASHGSLTCLAWAVQNPSKVSYLYLALPANDIQDIVANRGAGLAGVGLSVQNVYNAWGGSSSTFNAAMPSGNPAHNASALAGIPTKLLYSSNDPIVDVSTVTALASAIGTSCTTVNTGANGHSTNNYVDTAFGAFLAANS
jgi:hypothetical protein